jgi:hypothetical protein
MKAIKSDVSQYTFPKLLSSMRHIHSQLARLIAPMFANIDPLFNVTAATVRLTRFQPIDDIVRYEFAWPFFSNEAISEKNVYIYNQKLLQCD